MQEGFGENGRTETDNPGKNDFLPYQKNGKPGRMQKTIKTLLSTHRHMLLLNGLKELFGG